MQHHQNQQIHITATHPHLRHIGHSPSSIICIQPTSASQLPVQIPSPHPHHSSSQQVQANDQMREHVQLKMEQQPPQLQSHLVQNASHYTAHQHQQQNGERASVIESSQPMIIECT